MLYEKDDGDNNDFFSMNASLLVAQQFIPHGTITFSVICDDGILMAADSRAVFAKDIIDPSSGKRKSVPAAYIDGAQKIFDLGNFKLSMAGVSMMGKRYFSTLTKDFNNLGNKYKTPEQTFLAFNAYLKELGVTDSLLKSNQFTLAGYVLGVPEIYFPGSNNGPPKRWVEKYIPITNHPDFDRYIPLGAPGNVLCKEYGTILADSIYKYASDRNDFVIGGQLDIIKLLPDGTFESLTKFEPKEFKNYSQFADAVLTKKIKVVYLYPDSEEYLKNLLLSGVRDGL